jgi:hypothetical protein
MARRRRRVELRLEGSGAVPSGRMLGPDSPGVKAERRGPGAALVQPGGTPVGRNTGIARSDLGVAAAVRYLPIRPAAAAIARDSPARTTNALPRRTAPE